MSRTLALTMSMMAILSTACVPIREIRTYLSTADSDAQAPSHYLSAPILSKQCNTGSATPEENKSIIEDYGNYLIGYAEFDDQGWSYAQDAQLEALRSRLKLDLANSAYDDMDFAVIVFVHGWHHNAHENDCNVQEMRQMVHLASERFEAAYHEGKLQRKRRVFGIYAAWRGESVDADLLRYTTVIDRRDAAEKVAKGSIRQLLANLHEQEIAARANSTRTTAADRATRMYTTVVGHSFGGLIVFNGLSQELIDELTAECTPDHSIAAAASLERVWPDEVVLINPAFEASRFEPLNRLAESAAACARPRMLPVLTVVTADNDKWTGPVFTVGRRVLTLFEGYDTSTPETRAREKDANIHAIGFVDRYRTHRLCLKTTNGTTTVAVAPTPSIAGAAPSPPSRPVWVVGAPPTIVNGHDGFLYARSSGSTPQPYLLEWLISIHIPPGNAPIAANACGAWR